nr:MAG TPA: hypothetical protein [Bacteriophage sp.]
MEPRSQLQNDNDFKRDIRLSFSMHINVGSD